MVSMTRMIKQNLKSFFIFRTIRGRHIISLWASRIFEKSGIKRLFGINLVAAVFFAGVISPEADNFLNQQTLANNIKNTQIIADPITLTTFENPLTKFAISQNFSFWHPGIDMTASSNTPIYAIEEGVVEYANTSFLGYGKYVIIDHNHNVKSLYAHMSQIQTSAGRKVLRGELIGKVGSTGWSTGNHLHLEIFQEGKPLNPLEVLPIKKEEVKYETIAAQNLNYTPNNATTSASILATP